MTLTAYLATAVILTPLIFVVTERIGSRPLPPHRLLYSLVAAGLWPLMVVGLAQLGLVVTIRHIGSSRRGGPTQPMPNMAVQMAIPAR